MPRELVGARESAPAPRPLAPERALARVSPDVRLEVGAFEVRLAAARVRADVGAAALFGGQRRRSGVDEQGGLDGSRDEELHGSNRNKRRLHERVFSVHHGE